MGRALRIADAVLAGAAALALFHLVLGLRVHRPPLLLAVPVALAIVPLAARRLRPALRVRLAIAIVPALVAVHALEHRLGRSQPGDLTAAAARGDHFDTRSPWEVARDSRSVGVETHVAMPAREMIRWAEEHGEKTSPLGGIANRTIVLCNEGGAYALYDSDERGFDNPKGLWSRDAIDVAVLGEAFMAGACVPRYAAPVGLLRARHPATLSLAMIGNGPLVELAGLLGYLAPKRPRIVLWAYYHNDLDVLEVEKRMAALQPYLRGEGIQGLAGAQDALDRAFVEASRSSEASAPRWPGALATIGLGRTTTPAWLQDLVMGEDHSSTSAVLRLDRLNGAIAARLGGKGGGGGPDLALYRQILAKAKEAVASWGGTLHFVYLADVHHLRGAEHPQRAAVLSIVRDLGLPLVDLQPVFAAAPDPEALRYHPASHFNEAGYRLLADAVLAHLDQR